MMNGFTSTQPQISSAAPRANFGPRPHRLPTSQPSSSAEKEKAPVKNLRKSVERNPQSRNMGGSTESRATSAKSRRMGCFRLSASHRPNGSPSKSTGVHSAMKRKLSKGTKVPPLDPAPSQDGISPKWRRFSLSGTRPGGVRGNYSAAPSPRPTPGDRKSTRLNSS